MKWKEEFEGNSKRLKKLKNKGMLLFPSIHLCWESDALSTVLSHERQSAPCTAHFIFPKENEVFSR